MPYGHMWAYPFDGLFALAFIVLVIVAVAAVAMALLRRDRRPTDEAETILRARLARGEISAEEYEQVRRALGLK